MPAHDRAAVAGELDEVDRVEDRDGSREVGGEDEACLERRDENRLAIRVVARDLRSELAHPGGDLGCGDGAVVICAGGGGIPVRRSPDGQLHGVEAVVDKDATAALLAIALEADFLLLLTDVAAVEADYGLPGAHPICRTTPNELGGLYFPAGSMRPKIDAACRFVEATGRTAAIGALCDTQAILAGEAGTLVTPATANV